MGKSPGKSSANKVHGNYSKNCPGLAKFESTLSKGQARIPVFFFSSADIVPDRETEVILKITERIITR